MQKAVLYLIEQFHFTSKTKKTLFEIFEITLDLNG